MANAILAWSDDSHGGSELRCNGIGVALVTQIAPGVWVLRVYDEAHTSSRHFTNPGTAKQWVEKQFQVALT